MSTFGNMFYHFLIAVKTDPAMMLRPGRAAMFIATTAFFSTMSLTLLAAMILKRYVEMDTSLYNCISLIAMSQAFTGISVVSYLITELKLQNTDVGRLSLAIAVFSDLLNIVMKIFSFVAEEKIIQHQMKLLGTLVTTFGLIFVVLVIFRPMILSMIAQIPIGRPVDQKYVFMVLILTLILGFISEVIGHHYIFGPAIFGLVVPEGPPLGAALVTKLETFILSFFYPAYLAMSGLQTNIYKIHSRGSFIVGLIVLISIAVKTTTIMLVAMYMHMPAKDAFVLAMILNSKGILNLTIYNFWKENKLLAEEEFTLCIMSVIITTALITPLVRYLYDPTKQCQPFRRNNIQHSKPDSELRMLVCIHKPENVPTIVNLLEVSHATMESPISIIALVLVELVGRNTPLLISNDYNGSHLINDTSTASRIANALRQYEQHNEGCTNIQSFTSVSEYDTMHIDIFRLVMDRRTTILIVPFHKQWAIDGSVESKNPSIRRMNRNILNRAPCSVGILIDRGVLTGSMSVMNSLTKFKIAVIFIGGPDDAESLAYGARMARHENVSLTVIRFLVFGNENSIQRKRESELLFQYKQANMGNERFIHVEEVVRDGVGLSQCIGKIVNYFDLFLVGRHHEQSSLFTGLEDWSECPELGIIGDMLASPDMKTTASVLVVQQQRARTPKREQRAHVFPDDSVWSISMDQESHTSFT